MLTGCPDSAKSEEQLCEEIRAHELEQPLQDFLRWSFRLAENDQELRYAITVFVKKIADVRERIKSAHLREIQQCFGANIEDSFVELERPPKIEKLSLKP